MSVVLLLGVVVVVLYALFLMFRFTFDLIDRAHEELRERDAELPRLEDSFPAGERES